MANRDNLFTKGVYFVLGLTRRSKREIDAYKESLNQEVEENEEKGRKAVDNFIEGEKDSRTIVDEFFEKRLENLLEKVEVVKREDIDALSKKIDQLEKKLNN